MHFRRVQVEQPHAREAVGRRACRGGAATARANRARRCRGRTTRGLARRARSRRRPPSTSARTSVSIDSIVRDRCLPRNDGMAQNAHARSQPSATFTYAHGAVGAGRGSSSRSRTPTGLRRGDDITTSAIAPSPANPTTASASGNAAASSSPYRSAMHPVTTSLAPARFVSASASATSIDSWRAASMNAHVFTTTRSASDASEVGDETVGEQGGDDLVGVDGVLRAAERLDVEARRRSAHWEVRHGGTPGGHPRIVPTGGAYTPAVATEPTLWCPSCGAEYRADTTQCPDCRVALVPDPPRFSRTTTTAAWSSWASGPGCRHRSCAAGSRPRACP